ncbi:MAG: cation-transporting P-type ATPase, partial [Gammaproteobacteria bacterium]
MAHGFRRRLPALGAEPNGLDAASIARRLAEHGANALQEAGPTPAWKMVADQVVTAPVALLAGSAGIALLTGGLVDALAIATVVAINTVIGYGTERQSENVIRSLMVGAPERIPVIR